MAIYVEDWSGSTVGQEPTGWTKRWATTGITYEVVSDVDAPSGKALRIVRSVSGRSLITFDSVDADADRADVEVLVLVRTPATYTDGMVFYGSVGRGSGAAASETGYVGNIYSANVALNGYRRTAKYFSGAFTVISANTSQDIHTVGTLQWVRFRLNGTSQVLTVSPDSDRTATNSTSTTDSSISAAGWAGLFSFSAATTEVLWVGVATNGDVVAFPDDDVTAPVLTLPTGTTTGATTASGTVTTDEANGTLYAVVTASATPPSAADIRAGTGAVYSTSQAVSTTGVQNVSATGLTAETTYYWHFLHDDAADNASNIVTSASFTTDAAVVVVKGVRVRLYDAAGAAAASITGIQAAWFDQPEPKDALAPVFKTSTASTDASGWLELNIDSTTALAVAANGFLIAYKLDATNHQDSAVFAGRLAVEDIA